MLTLACHTPVTSALPSCFVRGPPGQGDWIGLSQKGLALLVPLPVVAVLILIAAVTSAIEQKP
jgi:hypothetical protein